EIAVRPAEHEQRAIHPQQPVRCVHALNLNAWAVPVVGQSRRLTNCCSGSPSWPGLARPSTSCRTKKDVDTRQRRQVYAVCASLTALPGMTPEDLARSIR